MKKLLIVFGVAVATAIALPASASAYSYDGYESDSSYGWDDKEYCQEKADSNIVETLSDDGDFTTLVAAVQAAGLEEALSGPGEKTVFAPTDEAFANLPEGTVQALLADIPTLTKILAYHVVDGQVDSEMAVDLGEATTLNGQKITISTSDDGVYINDSKLVTTDIETSNGIIHVIDAVLMPQL